MTPIRLAAEVLGWGAFVLNVWGNMKLTTKSKVGWMIRLVANVAWIIYSFFAFAWPLFINHIAFFYINIVGWRRWNREEKHAQSQPHRTESPGPLAEKTEAPG